MKDGDTLREDLLTADPEDETLFNRLLTRFVAALGLSERDVMHAFSMSLPGVRRWLNGRNAPLPPMRAFVYKRMVDLIDARSTPRNLANEIDPV